MAFHEVRFPTDIGYGARATAERRTDVVVLGSGAEERNARWADSRRTYQVGFGIRSLADLHAIMAFWEDRRGRLHGFRFKDWADFKSGVPTAAVAATDQVLGTGDGATATFQLVKVYGSSDPWTRTITKPVGATVRAAVDGVELTAGPDFTVDETTGAVTFATPPEDGLEVTAGFEFDVPVRFAEDRLAIDLPAFEKGQVPDITVVELRA